MAKNGLPIDCPVDGIKKKLTIGNSFPIRERSRIIPHTRMDLPLPTRTRMDLPPLPTRPPLIVLPPLPRVLQGVEAERGLGGGQGKVRNRGAGDSARADF